MRGKEALLGEKSSLVARVESANSVLQGQNKGYEVVRVRVW